MKTLSNLSYNKGSKKKKKRVGRGIGSGLGKTATRGHKGQKARKSPQISPGFEGGQMPLYRRLPRRGFSNIKFKEKWEYITTGMLNIFNNGQVITPQLLKDNGLIKSLKSKIKLLSKGDLTKKLSIQVHKASKNATLLVEKSNSNLKLLMSSSTKEK